MVLISYTNIVVDEFNYCRNPFSKYLFFLTHMHADHYQGLSNNWDYGPIYCSQITKKLLLNKFPKLQKVYQLQLNTKHIIMLNGKNEINCQVYLFDSNHCAGSVMFLFVGYFGTILHTGDMRFNKHLIDNNPILFPPQNKNCQIKSIHIDEVIFDNTYCDPIFKFPQRSRVLKMIIDLIWMVRGQKQLNKVFICIDSIGKQQICVFLAEQFQTLIVVNQSRYKNILCMDIDIEHFTTNRNEGWIEIIRKNEKAQRMKQANCISITLTGWVNINSYYSNDERNFLLPYSLHSNFQQLQLFMKSVRPCKIHSIVKQNRKSQKINNIEQFSAYVSTLYFLKQRGIDYFKEKYMRMGQESLKYRSIGLEQQKQLRKLLQIQMDQEQKSIYNALYFQTKNRIKPSKLRKKEPQQTHQPKQNLERYGFKVDPAKLNINQNELKHHLKQIEDVIKKKREQKQSEIIFVENQQMQKEVIEILRYPVNMYELKIHDQKLNSDEIQIQNL